MSRRHRRHHGDSAVSVVLPITPMLDMSFQLLSFFIITFRSPSAAEGQMDMFLPAAGVAKAKSAEQVNPLDVSDKELEQQADVTVKIDSESGVIDKLTIVEKEGQKVIADNNIKDLKDELKKLHATLGQANIKIESERRLKYVFLVQVMDACLQAGFKSVGFAPPPDLNQ